MASSRRASMRRRAKWCAMRCTCGTNAAFRAEELRLLRAAWDKGEDSGVAGPLAMKAIIAEGRSEAATAR